MGTERPHVGTRFFASTADYFGWLLLILQMLLLVNSGVNFPLTAANWAWQMGETHLPKLAFHLPKLWGGCHFSTANVLAKLTNFVLVK